MVVMTRHAQNEARHPFRGTSARFPAVGMLHGDDE
ncbi:hypothetical protein N825_22845 [Skermanella stibiiresistens SB22]|uniref:Uncharacterized protein n=1 Tax=Skermanella stibiiresistens SB22 TaxID=1385369 RepID=W9GZP0_9PROT|nr:hypothetical protein N825_22845 [Skermanella stibiiresistens SB22]